MKQHNILVVEDDTSLLSLYKKILESQGLKVDCVTNGSEAGFKINRALYDLIITDIQMPYMDGVTLINNVRKGMGNNNIPIVVVSGVLNKNHILALSKRNIAKIFSKPINVSEFGIYINTLLQNEGNPSLLKDLHPTETPAAAEEAEEFEIN